MIGYKAFNQDLTCDDIHYVVGQTVTIKQTPVLHEKGFHFCEELLDCFSYFDISCLPRICKVIAIGVTDCSSRGDSIMVTNELYIEQELTKEEIEATIAKSPAHALRYARDVIKGKWRPGEAAIATDSTYSYLYARDVVKGRWKPGEAAIATNNMDCFLYRKDVMSLEGLNYLCNILETKMTQCNESTTRGKKTHSRLKKQLINKQLEIAKRSAL